MYITFFIQVDDDVRTKLIGITIPRCSDSVDNIKEYALECMKKLICSKVDYSGKIEYQFVNNIENNNYNKFTLL